VLCGLEGFGDFHVGGLDPIFILGCLTGAIGTLATVPGLVSIIAGMTRCFRRYQPLDPFFGKEVTLHAALVCIDS